MGTFISTIVLVLVLGIVLFYLYIWARIKDISMDNIFKGEEASTEEKKMEEKEKENKEEEEKKEVEEDDEDEKEK